MTRIDFYILTNDAADARQQFTCRLVEKAYAMDNQVYVHTQDVDQARELDELMWQYRADSFLPHVLNQHPEAANTPVVIGFEEHEPQHHNEVLVNLGDEVPMFFSRFERVAELVAGTETQKQQARERYKFYKARGYELFTHELKN